MNKWRISRLLGICFFLSLCMLLQQAKAQNLDTLLLENYIPVLGENILLPLPARAYRIQNQEAASGSNQDDSWITWEFADLKILFFTQKLPDSDGKNLFEAMAKADQTKLFKTKILADNESIKSMLSTPGKFDSIQSAILVNRLLVRTQSGTTFTISAFINQPGFKIKDKVCRLTERSFLQLKVKEEPREESTLKGVMAILSGKKDYSINLPLVAEAVNSLFRSKKKSR